MSIIWHSICTSIDIPSQKRIGSTPVYINYYKLVAKNSMSSTRNFIWSRSGYSWKYFGQCIITSYDLNKICQSFLWILLNRVTTYASGNFLAIPRINRHGFTGPLNQELNKSELQLKGEYIYSCCKTWSPYFFLWYVFCVPLLTQASKNQTGAHGMVVFILNLCKDKRSFTT